MSYRFEQDDGTIQESVRRIALGQINKAIEEVDDRALDTAETIHQVRTRCKKLRGLLRLIRPVFDDYEAENTAFREAGRSLSALRDFEVMIETHDALVETFRVQPELPAFARIRRRLARRQQEAARKDDTEAKLSAFRTAMTEARERVNRWRLDEDGFDALAGGLRGTYKRARKAMAQARTNPSPEAFHAWRRRSKDHWHHTRLMAPIWPEPMKAHRRAADRMSELLGNHHDLAVFRQTLTDNANVFGAPREVEILRDLIERRQATFEAQAFALGARLLGESAKDLTGRWEVYWNAWRGERPAQTAALAAA